MGARVALTAGAVLGLDVVMTDSRTKPEVDAPEGPAPDTLVIEDLIVGDGVEATPGANVTVHYLGVGYDSGEEFDSSWSRGETISFPLRGLIQGWRTARPEAGTSSRGRPSCSSSTCTASARRALRAADIRVGDLRPARELRVRGAWRVPRGSSAGPQKKSACVGIESWKTPLEPVSPAKNPRRRSTDFLSRSPHDFDHD